MLYIVRRTVRVRVINVMLHSIVFTGNRKKTKRHSGCWTIKMIVFFFLIKLSFAQYSEGRYNKTNSIVTERFKIKYRWESNTIRVRMLYCTYILSWQTYYHWVSTWFFICISSLIRKLFPFLIGNLNCKISTFKFN